MVRCVSSSVCRGAAAVMLVLTVLAPHARAAETVRVGTPASDLVFALLDVGKDAGIFARHGIDLQHITFGGGGKLAQGMTAGSIDMALSGSTDLVFIAKGMPAKAVAVVLGPPVDMSIIVRTGGPITQPDQLKGKLIGVTTATSLTAWLAADFARHEGWKTDDVKPVPVGSSESAIAALRTGNLDAFVGPTGAAYELQAKNEAMPLLTFGYLHNFITHFLYARDSLIADHPEIVRQFIAAWFETVTYARGHKDETLKLIMPQTGLSPAVASRIFDDEMPALSSDGRFDATSFEAVAQSFVDLHLLGTPPAAGALYTEKFLP